MKPDVAGSMNPAGRLAALVDPEVLSATLDHLEHMRRVGRGGQIRWHVDDDGAVQVVDCQGTLYRRRPAKNGLNVKES